MSETKTQRVPCFLCGDGLDIRASKRSKPYLVCDACGVQIFVRRESGIARLDKLRLGLAGKIIVHGREAELEVTALANRHAELKAKLKEIEDGEDIFAGLFGNEHPAKGAIKRQLETLEARLRSLSEGA